MTMLSYIASSPAALEPAGLANAKGLITSQFVKPADSPALAEDAGVRRYLADHAAGITLSTKGPADPYPIESLQLMRFDGENYEPLGAVMSFEGKTPKHN